MQWEVAWNLQNLLTLLEKIRQGGVWNFGGFCPTFISYHLWTAHSCKDTFDYKGCDGLLTFNCAMLLTALTFTPHPGYAKGAKLYAG